MIYYFYFLKSLFKLINSRILSKNKHFKLLPWIIIKILRYFSIFKVDIEILFSLKLILKNLWMAHITNNIFIFILQLHLFFFVYYFIIIKYLKYIIIILPRLLFIKCFHIILNYALCFMSYFQVL